MPEPDARASLLPPQVEVQKAFDIHARHHMELELRLERFSRALGVQGGRVVAVCRGHSPAGGHLASVQYSLPLSAAGDGRRGPRR